MEKLKQNNLESGTTELGFVKNLNANYKEYNIDKSIALSKEVELEDGTKVIVENITPHKMKEILNDYSTEETDIISFRTPGENVEISDGSTIKGVVQTYNANVEDYDTSIEAYILNSTKSGAETVDISSYNISADDEEALISELSLDEDLYYVSNIEVSSYETITDTTVDDSSSSEEMVVSLNEDEGTKIIKELKFTYIYTPEEIADYDEKLEEVANDFLAGTYEDWTDYDKVLYTYVYIKSNLAYTNDTSEDYSVYTIIGGLLNKQTDQYIGLAKTVNYLLKKLNIESSILVNSDDNTIVWNFVKVNGEYRHIGICLNDYYYGEYTPTLYPYTEILLTDDEVTNGYGYIWESDIKSSTTSLLTEDTYIGKFLQYRCNCTPIYVDGYWYGTNYKSDDTILSELVRINFKKEILEYGQGLELFSFSGTFLEDLTYDGKNFYSIYSDSSLESYILLLKPTKFYENVEDITTDLEVDVVNHLKVTSTNDNYYSLSRCRLAALLNDLTTEVTLSNATSISTTTTDTLSYNFGAYIFNILEYVTIDPEYSVGTFEFKSSDETIATIDSFGLVSGSSEGDITLTISLGSTTLTFNLHLTQAA